MPRHSELTTAQKDKNDEFYTQLEDIEKELCNYTDLFQGKSVYCNCDDPEQSNFWKYFADNFDTLKLNRLVATFIDKDRPAVKTEIIRDAKTGEKGTPAITPLTQHGDFRSEECRAILQKADIVVTNPPFSLFREYIAQLFAYQKQFLVMGNMNAVTYKEIFPLIKTNKLWYGPSISSGDREFRVPNSYPLTAAGSRIDEAGNKFVRVKGIRWFTNLDHMKRHERLQLTKTYADAPDAYPHYINCNAINVDKTSYIPVDYQGVMGVPITFLDKYCPEQFELIRFRHGDDGKDLCYQTTDGVKTPYFRILIQPKPDIS